MSKGRTLASWVLVAATLLTLSNFIPAAARAQDEPPASPVEAEVVENIPIVPTTRILGAIEPKRRSIVAAAIEGYVIDFPIEEGVYVKKDQALARLRDRMLRLRLREAEAALAEVRERHMNAQKELKRAEVLIERDAVTQKELEDDRTEERTLALRIPQAEARIEILKADIEKKIVVAPFAGQVVREHVQVGEWVERGGSVASIVDLSSVYVRVNVAERYIRYVKEGHSVRVWVQAAKDDSYRAKIVSVSGEGDDDARTFPVRLELKNDGKLRSGMSARVELPVGVERRALAVLKDAILMRQNRHFVFVVGEDGMAKERRISVGVSAGKRLEVTKGVQSGEQVVTRGNERIRSGMPLRVIPTKPKKAHNAKPEEGAKTP